MFLSIFKKEKGLGLLEILLTIAVASVIIIMSVGYYQSISKQEKINYFVDQVNAVVDGTHKYLASHIGQNISYLVGSNIAQVFIQNNVIKPEDAMNVWQPGSYYSIGFQKSNIKGTTNCPAISFVVTMPAMYRSTSTYNEAFCKPIQEKLTQTYGVDKTSFPPCNASSLVFYICL